jgi:copper transporter 1
MVAHDDSHDASAMESMGGMGEMSESGHSSMPMAFFTATDTPLYSMSWTPSSAGAYAGTCIFLILLAITLRVLFTAKSFLDAKARSSALRRRYVVVEGQQAVGDKAFNDASSTTGILMTNGLQENVRIVEATAQHTQPWRFSVDLPRAAILTLATAVGYLL